ncbi:MAG: HAD family hydrolase [Nanoarchaeota archaeon]|nr:HAD family hydrolase [Nanoarchaeota archaeon]
MNIVLLDIDGTIYDNKYRTNSDKLPSLIEKTSNENIYVLNSNRSLYDLFPIWNEFNLNGPIIVENGSFIYFPQKNKKIILTKIEENSLVKNIIFRLIKDNFVNSITLDIDTVDFLKKNNYEKMKNFDIILLSNKFRKFTLSLHLKINNEGTFVKDNALGSKIVEMIKGIKAITTRYNVVYSKAFGNILVTPKDCDKSTAFIQLKKKIMPNFQAIMIGDDRFDLPLIESCNYFFCVANADNIIKNQCNYVSKYPFTKGVVEIIENMQKLMK